MNAYFAALKKYGDFSGRARRSEYWSFSLISAAIYLVLLCTDIFVQAGKDTDSLAGNNGYSLGFLGILAVIYYLAVMLPSLAVFVRRLHDTGRSGWWWFISIVPIVGAIVILVFLVTDSQPGPNKYGPNPKDMSTMSAS
jgi:uncharacterized membrane protein YhaH (DUF805 family)